MPRPLPLLGYAIACSAVACTLFVDSGGLAGDDADASTPAAADAATDVAPDVSPDAAPDAGLEDFPYGNGQDGAETVLQNRQLVGPALVLLDVPKGASEARVDATDVFHKGQLVLFHDTSRVVGADRAASSTLVPDAERAGEYFFARVISLAGDHLTFTPAAPIDLGAALAQVLPVAEYTTLKIDAAARLGILEWNGTRGGVGVVVAKERVTIDGMISATGAGHRGGKALLLPAPYKSGCAATDGAPDAGYSEKGEGVVAIGPIGGRGRAASGGGGGNCANGSGGGGGAGGQGGAGGGTWSGDGYRAVGGMGGASLAYDVTRRVFFGGGGGAGEADDDPPGQTTANGANGGGVLFVFAPIIEGAGRIESDGAVGDSSYDNGSGGGGGGGTLVVHTEIDACKMTIYARGGLGGSGQLTSGGGGGGGGHVHFRGPGVCATDVAAGTPGATGLPSIPVGSPGASGVVN